MKKGPFIFLGILVVVLFFIIGMQFGKRVKTADEALQLLLTIAPSPSVSPVPESLKTPVKQLTSTTCGFSLLYPADLIAQVTSSMSGVLIDKNQKPVIDFTCDAKPIAATEATGSVSLAGTNATEYTDESTTTLQIAHPSKKDLTLTLKFPINYRTLIERTLEFNK